MKIITWNCNMAFRKKAHHVLKYNPDILVIPECEHPDKFVHNDIFPKPNHQLWFGSNPNKGLGIFSYSNFTLRVRRIHDHALKMIVPIVASDNSNEFNLYAIWANNPDDPDGQYVEQVWKAIHHYNKYITKKGTILIGDFNSNTIWDRKYRIGNHSHLVEKLAKKNIHSCYHAFHDQQHGVEAHPTFYLYKHFDKPYHLDYCFASSDLIDKLASVEIGTHADWNAYSDHVPVMITFNGIL